MRVFSKALMALVSFLAVACAPREQGSLAEKLMPTHPVLDMLEKDQPKTFLQTVLEQGVPPEPIKEALLKYDLFADRVSNRGAMAIIDMSQTSDQKRFYLIDQSNGSVQSFEVAHGSGSDPQNIGLARYFSNVPESKMTSLGSYLISERYNGKYGASLRLDGLEMTNSNARSRDIVLHPSNYVREGQKQGRSWGCPAIPFSWISTVLKRLEGGAFLYIYGINQRDVRPDRYLIQQWDLLPKERWPSEGEGAPLNGE